MTALVFALQPDQVCLAMDTLVVGADDRLPMSFQRKFLSLPDSELIVAGTGLANFINGWFAYLSALARVGDIDDLNAIAPGVLKASADAFGGLGDITTTLYHFGYSRKNARYVGYAYRSINEFRPEKLQDALGLKPVVPVAPTDNIQFPDFLIDIVIAQQRADRDLPIQQQLGIGGEIEFAVLSQRTTRIETVYRFISFERERQHIDSRGEA
jgi:hypothetical protein